MIFTQLTAENFLSFQSLEFNLSTPGITLLAGDNGAGKSSIFDALVWCMFGTTLKGLAGDDVVNVNTKKDCLVSVTIDLDGTQLVIQRARKHKEYKNALILYHNGLDVSEWDIKSTQDKIETLLGFDRTLFTNSSVFAQGFSQFFATLSDREQKELIERFVDAKDYDAAYELAKTEQSALLDVVKTQENTVYRCNTLIDSIRDDILDAEEKFKTFDDEKKDQLDELEQDLRKSMMSAKAKTKQLKAIKVNLVNLETRLEELESAESKVCKTCGQKLPDKQSEILASVRREISSADRERYQIELEIKNLQSRNDDLARQHSELQDSDNIYQTVISTLAKRLLAQEDGKLIAERCILESNQKLSTFSFWVEAFSIKGIRSFLFDSMLPEFNNSVEYYTQLLTDSQIHIRLNSTAVLKSGETRDKFSLTVINTAGGNSHKASSAGERRIIDLCVLWAMQDMARRKLASAVNFELYDECLDALDPTKVDSVVSVLREHSRERSVFVISHNEELKNAFDHVVMVSKSKGKSSLLMGRV